MNINKFSKSKNGMYIITLEDNSKIKVHEDLILKYDLLITKCIDDAIKEKLYAENKVYEIYEVATSYINKKLRSEKEIYNYLKKKEYSDDEISDVIVLLKRNKFLDDMVYACSLVNDRINLTMDGPNKIRKELENNNISNSLIENVMSKYDAFLEDNRINKIIDKQLKLNKNKGTNLLKRKIQYQLINLGYDIDRVNSNLNRIKSDDKKIYEKEYEKEKNRLSKKYSGKELEYKLRQRMYQKGFTNDFYE